MAGSLTARTSARCGLQISPLTVLSRPRPATGGGTGRHGDRLDKGKEKGAVLNAERTIVDKKSGEPIATMTSAAMLRGDGGFGGKPGPQPAPHALPQAAPMSHVDIKT